MSDNFIPGQAVIDSVLLVAPDGSKTQDITSAVAAFEIYEDITLPCVTCAVTIGDSIGLLRGFPINGAEFIIIRYKPITPEAKLTEIAFRVHEIKGHSISQNKRMQSYILKCVDVDLFNASKKLVQKVYNSTCADIISDITINYIESRPDELYVEPTKGKQHIVIPNVNPYKAIDLVRRRSVSQSYEYSPYYFFRTVNQGFVFSSLAFLYERSKSSPSRTFNRINQFILDNKSTIPSPIVEYNNILGVIRPRRHNHVSKLSNGAFSSVTNHFDLVTKQFKSNVFNISKSDFKVSRGKSYEGFLIDQSTTPSHTHFIVVDSSRPKTYLADTIGSKIAYSNMITEDAVSIQIHGDNRISVGDVIHATIPILDANELDGDEVDTTTLSGHFIVTKVKHIVINEYRVHFKTELQLIKNIEE